MEYLSFYILSFYILVHNLVTLMKVLLQVYNHNFLSHIYSLLYYIKDEGNNNNYSNFLRFFFNLFFLTKDEYSKID